MRLGIRISLIFVLLIYFTVNCLAQKNLDLYKIRKDSHNERLTNQSSSSDFPYPQMMPNDIPIEVTSGGSETFLIQDFLLGDLCLVPTNMEARPAGSPSFGTFASGLSSIGIEEGVILATGNSQIALGPNNSSNDGTTGGGSAGFDSDLSAISGSSALFNVTILEFDFIPDENEVAFDYVFASEEYCEYVSTVFNDAFGFFLSGPGISGPYTDNAINIATIPGTATPVAINNVNWTLNSEYYVTNALLETPGTPPGNCTVEETNQPTPLSNLIEYDGFTKKLTARAEVIPCETYHIKIAIADVGDGIFDSAVFLGKNSFVSGENNTRINVVSGYIDSDDDAAEEGCENAYIAFEKIPPTESIDISFVIDPASTATEGLDFANLPDSYTIPAGVQYDTLWIDIFGDLLLEGIESFIITIEGLCECVNPMVEIFIEDPVPVERTVHICEGDFYDGPNGPIFDSQEFLEVVTYPDGCDSLFLTSIDFNPITFHDTLLYGCFFEVIEFEGEEFELPGDDLVILNNQNYLGCDSIIFVTIEWINPNYPIAEPDLLTCLTDSIQLESTNQDYNSVLFTWEGPNGFSSNEYEPWVSVPGIYKLYVTQTIGDKTCISIFDQQVLVIEDVVNPDLIDILNQELFCGESSDSIFAILENIDLISDIEYEWTGPNGFMNSNNSISVSDSGSYALVVTNLSNGCEDSTFFQITSLADQPDISILNSDIGCNSTEAILATEVSIPGGNYSWVGPNGFTSTEGSPIVADTGTYELTYYISDDCQAVLSTSVGIDNTLPTVSLEGDTLTCEQTDAILVASVDNFSSVEWVTPSNQSLNNIEIEVSEPGVYYFFSTGNNGCVAEDSIELILIAEVSDFSLDAEVISCISNEVIISMSSNDILSYSTITPSNDTITNTDPLVGEVGLYQVIAVNQYGCESYNEINVEIDTLSPSATLDVPTITCDNSLVNVNLENPNQQFTQTWSGPNSFSEESESVEINVPGQYQVTLVSENGCEQVYDFVVEIDTLSPNVSIANDTIECISNTATLVAEGLSAEDEIQWFNSFDNSLLGESPVLVVENSGDYYAVVTNSQNGCESIQSASVLNDINFPIISATSDTLTCLATTVEIQTTSDDPDLTYVWSGPGGFNSSMDSPIISEAGAYELAVTNDLGCETSIQIEVFQDTISPDILVSGGELDCINESLILAPTLIGDIEIISWTGPGNFDAQTEQATVSNPGIYTLVVTGTNGCTATEEIEITDNTIFPLIDTGVTDTLTCEIPEVSVSGSHDGPIQSQLSWQGPNGFTSDQAIFTTDESGFYILEVTPPNGCVVYDTVEVQADFSVIEIQVVDGHLNCFNPVFLSSNTYSGGVIESFEWTGPNNFSSSLENPEIQEDGSYSLIVTGANGCTSEATVNITSDFELPSVSIVGDTISCENSEVSIEAESNADDLTYSWVDENDNTYTTSIINTSTSGTYVLTLTNNINGCSTVDSIEILELPDLLEFDWLIDDPDCFISTGMIEFTEIEGGTPPFLYSIDGGSTFTMNPTFTNLAVGDYDLQVMDAESCNLSAETIIVPFVEDIATDNLYVRYLGEALSFELETSLPPDEIASILWSPSSNLSCNDCFNPQLIALEDEIFTVVITDINGCIYEAIIELRVLERPIYVPNIFTPNNNGENEYFTIFGDFEPIEIVTKFSIYDRWGNFVYGVEDVEPDDLSMRWYGDFNGRPAKEGVYAYIVNYLTLAGEAKSLSGDVTLIR